jgi:hypothetical protein
MTTKTTENLNFRKKKEDHLLLFSCLHACEAGTVLNMLAPAALDRESVGKRAARAR